jgi:hypothetical protein
MGKVAVVNRGGSEITLSMVRWRARRLALFWGKKLGIINRFAIAPFLPNHELAVYDGGPDVVLRRGPISFSIIPIRKSLSRNGMILLA